ncbi:MAG: FtsH protease activity modulator HflK [Candidatus Delongbacteria bacterium]|nr:FtsH protease activity modulator HflK [Candidatus Delongbacteria bacterium]
MMGLNPNTIRIPGMGVKLAGYLFGLLVGLVILFSTWFTISPEEVGVILRFGRFSRQAEPGLNFKLPLGIESVYKVPVQRQLKEEFGFRTIQSGVRSSYSEESFDDEALMLTGDLNAARVEWIIQYRIVDPVKYLFKVRNTRETFRDMSESIVREIVGDRTVNEVLTVGRQEVASSVTLKLQELCDQYETGIKVEQVVLQDVNPPDEVKPSFNEVNEAQQEREKLINQARSEYNKIIPKAGGDAQRMVEEAKGYALERVNEAQGDALRFNSLYREYIKAKDVTRQRVYLETMHEVLSKVGRKLITDDKASGILPLFQFDLPKSDRNGAKNE